MGGGVFRILAAAAGLFLSTACIAQSKDPAFESAKQNFAASAESDRVASQVALTAAGYWSAVPNISLGGRLFRAYQQFQQERGLEPTGTLTPELTSLIFSAAEPLLRKWRFQAIGHPTKGRPIWVPLGLGLQASRETNGISWSDATGTVKLQYLFFEGIGVENGLQALLQSFTSDGATIQYKVARPQFFVISSSRDGVDSYIRYQRTPDGVLGFRLLWLNSRSDLHMERVATLISGSLAASFGQGPFLVVPQFPPPPAENRDASRKELPPISSEKPPTAPLTKSSSGTGFFVTAAGHILTNAHVVDGCSSISIAADAGQSGLGSVLARDTANDLAIVATTLKPKRVAAFGGTSRLGEQVAAFGFPLSSILASTGNFTLGNVTATSGLKDDSRYLQISAPVQPGNSGGPLLDDKANVVGVVSAKLNALRIMLATDGDIPQNVNFALKASTSTTFLESNRVNVNRVPLADKLTPPDIADAAREMSVFIRCSA